MNEIKIFSNQQFGDVRVAVTETGEPMFCLADVCAALDLTNPRQVKTRLNPRGVQLIDLQGVTNNDGVIINELGNTVANFINEANLYKCIFQSRKPEAEKFQDWVCEDVLPSIRKHGAYMSEQVIERTLTDPDYLIQLATALKDERQKRIAAESKVAEDAPKVNFANAVIASSSSCLIGELAKILTQNGYEIGQNRLFQWLRENGYLGKHGERRNIPNQQYIEQGLFELKKGVRSGNDGVMKTTITPKITTKGQAYFINKFINA